MGVSCDPGCADWAKSFGDCICSPKDLSSFVLGLISVFCMGICCLPQIIINFMNGSSEGLSLGMILIWSVGDVCNLTGVFLTKALPTQVYMAVLFAVLDLLLNFQHCWYCYWIIPRRKKRQLAQGTAASTAPGSSGADTQHPAGELQLAQKPSEAQDLSNDLTTDDSHNTVSVRPTSNHNNDGPTSQAGIKDRVDEAMTSRHGLAESWDAEASIPAAHQLRAVSAGLMLVGCGMMTTSVPTIITAGLTGTLPGASDYRSTSGVWTQQHAGIGRVLLSDSGSSAASGKTVNIGQGLGWVMTVTYLGARVPQIFKNLRRGTTKGLSLFMFVLLVLGSITYVLSIFIRSVERQFVVPKLPWLIEALGAILLDGTIVLQIFYYRYRNRNRPAPALPVSDLPLGSIAP